MQELRWIVVTFALMMIVPAVGQESGEQQAFAGHWALEMSNGAAGWMALELNEGEWSGQLWTVGQPKTIKSLRYADGKLTFKRALRIGPPEYPGGPSTGEREMRDLEASVKGDSMRVVMEVPGGQTLFISASVCLPYPPDPIFPR